MNDIVADLDLCLQTFVYFMILYPIRQPKDDCPISCSCARYVRYEGVMTALGVEVVGMMMLIRCVVRSVRPAVCANRCQATRPLLRQISINPCVHGFYSSS
jgi:hypothetical protein